MVESGFELAPSDQPEIVALASKAGYVMVSPAQVVPAAPAPLAKIHDQVAADWVNDQARQRAAAAAVGHCGQGFERDVARRRSQDRGNCAAAGAANRPRAGSRSRARTARCPRPCACSSALGQGKSRMAPDPGGRGFYIVKTNTIIPGNALLAAGTDQPHGEPSCRRACPRNMRSNSRRRSAPK